MNRISTRRVLIIAAGMLAWAVWGCDTIHSLTQKVTQTVSGNGNSARTQEANDALLMGNSADPALGQAVAADLIGRYGLSDNSKLNRYVALVGLTVASVSDRPDGNWYFAVLNSDQVNTYSAPGGYVMITLGAIRQMHDEAELAGAMANEMTHVINHDVLHMIQVAPRPAGPATTQSLSAADQRAGQFAQFADAAIDAVVVKGYDFGQEKAADTGAINLLEAAGYSPASYLNFIQRLAQAQPQGGVAVMKTHPNLPDRAQAIQKQISKLSAAGGRSNRGRFEDWTGVGG